MKVGDITSGEHTLISLQRKGKVDKSCRIGVTDKVLDAIHDYLVCRGEMTEDSPLFVTHKNGYASQGISDFMISKMVKRYLRVIGLDDKCYSPSHCGDSFLESRGEHLRRSADVRTHEHRNHENLFKGDRRRETDG